MPRQHYNHIHFWKWMKPGGGGDKIPGKLEKQITADLGPLAKMKEEFIQAGITQFGSGWCWLAVKDGKIVVMKTPNGENPLVHGGKPILGCDVWEHSYYIDYRNRRPDYLKAFFDHLVNWDYVAEMYEAAIEVTCAGRRKVPRSHGTAPRSGLVLRKNGRAKGRGLPRIRCCNHLPHCPACDRAA